MVDDAELDVVRRTVSCAAVLERMVGGWKLDARQSTRSALKYRHGAGEIIIINHDGRGWWNPLGSEKGDVFNLVQHLDPSLTFVQVCRRLRGFVGIAPSGPEAAEVHALAKADRTAAQRWAECTRLTTGDPAWSYLAGPRGLPAGVLTEASRQDAVRLGSYRSAWLAYRWHGEVSHVEVRSPTFKGSLRGGRKTLFQFGNPADGFVRLAVLEAPIDALSLAAIEQVRSDTLYTATGGGMGPGTIEALQQTLARLHAAGGVLVSGADANAVGDRYAARHAELAGAAGVGFERLRPPDGTDWNDVLVKRREA